MCSLWLGSLCDPWLADFTTARGHRNSLPSSMQDKRNDDVDSINSDEFAESTCSILRRCANNTIESLKSFIEGATGVDFDGDGNVGGDWQVHPYDFEANEFHLIIGTIEGGHNSGKNYVHRIANEDAQAWYELIHRQVRLAKEASRQRKIEEKYGTSRYSMYRAIVHRAYTSNTFQSVSYTHLTLPTICSV